MTIVHMVDEEVHEVFEINAHIIKLLLAGLDNKIGINFLGQLCMSYLLLVIHKVDNLLQLCK